MTTTALRLYFWAFSLLLQTNTHKHTKEHENLNHFPKSEYLRGVSRGAASNTTIPAPSKLTTQKNHVFEFFFYNFEPQ